MSRRTVIRPDRATYLRTQAWMAAAAMALGMAVLFVMGNPHVWTGAIGGLAAIGLRAWYLASDELGIEWQLTDSRLDGPGWRQMALADITRVRRLGSAVQVITRSGDKHLLKYNPDPDSVVRAIETARAEAAA